MVEIEVQETWDNLDLVHEFVAKVQQYVPGSLGWIARQMDTDRKSTDDYGFVIGQYWGSINILALRNMSKGEFDPFARIVASTMMGYAPDSKEDLERKLQNAMVERNQAVREISRHKEYRDKWEAQIQQIELEMIRNGWEIPSFKGLYERK